MESTGLNFLFVGSAAYSNRGCEAIVRGTVEILSTRLPGSRYIVSSGFDDFPTDGFEKVRGVEYRPPAPPGWTRAARVLSPQWWFYRVLMRSRPALTYKHVHSVALKAMQECDCALQVGGDNYTLDYGVPDYLLRLDDVLLATGKPLILWGASVGPFSRMPSVERRLAKHLRRLTLILARESKTIAYLASIGVQQNVRCVADPAFCMTAVKPRLDDHLAAFLLQRPVGLNLSAFAGKFTTTHDPRSWLENARACVDRLLAAGLGPVLLVPHVFKESNDDHRFLLQVMEGLPRQQAQLAILPRNLNAAELKWVIGQTRLFAGARMHSTIAALSSCVPTLSLGYSMKASGVSEDIFGHPRWLLSVDELNPDSLSDRMAEMERNRMELEKHLRQTIPEVQRRSRLAASFVLEACARQ